MKAELLASTTKTAGQACACFLWLATTDLALNLPQQLLHIPSMQF